MAFVVNCQQLYHGNREPFCQAFYFMQGDAFVADLACDKLLIVTE